MLRTTVYLRTERVFIVSIRQDIDKGFTFPEKQDLTLRLNDVVENTVDDKYYLSESRIDALIKHKERNAEKGNGFGARFLTGSDIASTLVTDPDKTLQYLLVKQATKKGYIEGFPGDYVNLQFPNSKTRRGRVTTGYANTLLCNDAQGVITEDLEIRKLTPKECFRLMGFDDQDVDTLKDNGISDAQLYKMAGNSIVVNVVYHIFEQLRSTYPDIFPRGQMSIKDLMREEV